MESIRLNKYLSDAGICSRRQADRWIEEKRITVNGEIAGMGMKVAPDSEVCLDGKLIKKEEKKVLLAMNKPAGIVCTAEKRERNNIVDYMKYPKRINPVAIFTPVELEGSTVSRASVHNISIMRKLELGIGDRIRVYKANMIIPQIGENLTKSGVKDIPSTCPACGGKTVIEKVNDVEALYCRNPECPAKAIKGFTLFVSRDAMNIDGLSEATLEKFIARGFIKNFGDIFEIGKHKDEIIRMEGFGEKSYENLIESLKRAKKTELPRVLYALGIPNIGLANAKMICKELNYDMEKIRYASEEELAAIDGIGPVIAKSFVNYFKKEGTQEKLDHLLSHLEIEAAPKQVETQIFENMNFVITGSVEHFANRKEVKEEIEKRGGKVMGSVTSKTSYLINNDTRSASSKNRKAKELGIPIISEEMFLKMMEEGV